MSFGEYIKKLRIEKGLGVNDLAKLSGLSNAQISRLENGKNKQPRPENIEKLASALDVPSDILLKKAGLLKITSPQFDALTMLREALDPRFYEDDTEYERYLYHMLKDFSDLEADKFKDNYASHFWLLSHLFGFDSHYPSPSEFLNEASKLSANDRMKLALDIGKAEQDRSLDLLDFLKLPNLRYNGKPLSQSDITRILEMLRILVNSKED